jgi:predicted Rossmann fold flavoprotein
MKQSDIFIIGGGASGMIAAIIAKQNHANVTILERNPKVGKKILATGNGRCNYTNALAQTLHYNHPEFVEKAFSQFGPTETLRFFENLGIVPKIEEQGKTYPLSEQASSIVDVLLYELERLNVEIIVEAFVIQLIRKHQKFIIILSDGTQYEASKVILCTGGKAMPLSGSDGMGYELARKLGHQLTVIFPSLVKLTLQSPYLKHLEGVKFPGRVELLYNNETIQSEFGDILFTKYGISGPTILQLSRKANESMALNKTVIIKVVLVTQLQRMDVVRRFQNAIDRPVDFSLIGLIHKKIIPAILKEAGIDKNHRLVSEISQTKIDKIIELLFDWRFTVTGSKSFEDAQVTAGGIKIEEINPETMESKLVKNLYFAGEIIDIDGLCGGYNLQWAWSSGYLAGLNASQEG